MEVKTLEALRESIEHWDRLASGNRNRGETVGPSECALCGMFSTKPFEGRCEGCPVKDRTGLRGCEGSPYDQVMEVYEDLENEGLLESEILDHPRFKEVAKLELEFLRSLVPSPSQTP